MEFKGTKGKWYTIEDNYKILITCDNPNWHICETLSNFETDKANAKLIAAAPEMFEMLIRLRDTEEFDITDYIDLKQLITKITE